MSSGAKHSYRISVDWTGNRGTGTSAYDAYGRDHVVRVPGKPDLQGSSDPAFRGDADRYNPEDLLVAALSTCHMLWYLHLCADKGIVVTAYADDAEGVMETERGGAGRFVSVTLRPRITLAPGADRDTAVALHEQAHEKCYVANSVNFPVTCEPDVSVSSG